MNYEQLYRKCLTLEKKILLLDLLKIEAKAKILKQANCSGERNEYCQACSFNRFCDLLQLTDIK